MMLTDEGHTNYFQDQDDVQRTVYIISVDEYKYICENLIEGESNANGISVHEEIYYEYDRYQIFAM